MIYRKVRVVFINCLSDELIFYIGLAIFGFSAIAMIIFMVTSRIKLIKLNNRLDEEYGKEKIN